MVWALFDSGNGCYSKAAKKFEDIEIYSIGIDRKNKSNHFINLNLADYSRLFGDNTLFDHLDSLPNPDLSLQVRRVNPGLWQVLWIMGMPVGNNKREMDSLSRKYLYLALLSDTGVTTIGINSSQKSH